MSVKVLSEAEKHHVILYYQNKNCNIKTLAESFGVSSRTISRVLEQAGVMTERQLKGDEWAKTKKVFRKYGIKDLVQLDQILRHATAVQVQVPLDFNPVNQDTVQTFLNGCTKEQLAIMFYQSGLIKIAELHNGSVMNATQRMQEGVRNLVADGQPRRTKPQPVTYAPKYNYQNIKQP